LQHSIKEINGKVLRQIPTDISSQPDQELLAERYEVFRQAS
jgi:hypothetical protein